MECKHCCYEICIHTGNKKAKGIKKVVIKKNISHENYKDTLLNQKQIHHVMRTIRSINHNIGSYKINKISLSCFDDKRYLLDDGITSYAYGHEKIDIYPIENIYKKYMFIN